MNLQLLLLSLTRGTWRNLSECLGLIPGEPVILVRARFFARKEDLVGHHHMAGGKNGMEVAVVSICGTGHRGSLEASGKRPVVSWSFLVCWIYETPYSTPISSTSSPWSRLAYLLIFQHLGIQHSTSECCAGQLDTRVHIYSPDATK